MKSNGTGVVNGLERVDHWTDAEGNPVVRFTKEATHDTGVLRSRLTLKRPPELMVETRILSMHPEHPDVLVEGFGRWYFHRESFRGPYSREFIYPGNTLEYRTYYDRVSDLTPDSVPADWL